MSPRRKLGCLTGLILLAVLGCAGWLAITAAFAPWIFEAGGHFHAVPMWQGAGRLHSAISGDYVIDVYFYPTPGGFHAPGTWVEGQGYLCNAHRDRYRLRLTGGTSRRVWSQMDGSPFTLDMANRPILWSFTSPDYSTWHPRISLRGHWQYPVLVMDDGGSLSREFGPDGHPYSGSEKHSEPRETVSVTLKEASMSEFDAACAAIAR